MLIILRRFHKKPKYKPVAKANIWVVNDSDTGKTYFGPKDLNSCQKFIQEHQKEGA